MGSERKVDTVNIGHLGYLQIHNRSLKPSFEDELEGSLALLLCLCTYTTPGGLRSYKSSVGGKCSY